MPNELIPCDVCGNGIYEDDLIAVEHGTVHVCRDCYDAYARSCSVCGEMFLRTNMHSLRVDYDGYSYVCPECAESDSVSVFELKNPADETVSIADAYDQTHIRYSQDIPSLMKFDFINVISDGANTR